MPYCDAEEGKTMENPNSDKVGEIRRYKPRAVAQDGIFVLTREKLGIVVVMAAFAILLLAIAVLLTFGGDEPLGIIKRNHVHDYDMKIEFVNGGITLSGHCGVKNCDEPDILQKNVTGVTSTQIAPSCKSEGKQIYSLNYKGELLTCEVILAKTPHLINGEDVDRYKNSDGHLIHGNENVGVSGGAILKCDKVFSSDEGYFICSSCGERIGASVVVPHLYAIDLKYENSSFYMVYDCTKCDDTFKNDVTSFVTKTEEKPGTCTSNALTYYEYSYGGETRQCVVEGSKDPNSHALFEMNKKEDGSYDYVKGFTISVDGANIKCGGGQNSNFYLKCPDCEAFGVPGQITVNLPDHKMVYKKGNVIEKPTLEKSGKVRITCDNRWCDHEFEIEIEKVILGENGNTKANVDIHGRPTGTYRYKTITEDGYTIEIDLILQ